MISPAMPMPFAMRVFSPICNTLFPIVTLAFNVTVVTCVVTAVSKIFAMLEIGMEVWILFGSTAIVEVAIATIWDHTSSLSLKVAGTWQRQGFQAILWQF